MPQTTWHSEPAYVLKIGRKYTVPYTYRLTYEKTFLTYSTNA